MPTCRKSHAKWKVNMPQCGKYHTKWKVNMPTCSKSHAKWKVTCPNVANTMQNDKFKFQTVANTRQMVPAKKSKKNPKPAQKKNPKTISHPYDNMEYGGNRCFSSVLKSRAYNRIPSNFDTLDLWRLWKSSVAVLAVQDGVWCSLGIWNGISDPNLIKKDVNICLRIPHAGLATHTRGHRTPGVASYSM